MDRHCVTSTHGQALRDVGTAWRPQPNWGGGESEDRHCVTPEDRRSVLPLWPRGARKPVLARAWVGLAVPCGW